MQSEGTLAKSMPAGYEIYENPNAQVFLRRIPPKIITDEERQVVYLSPAAHAAVVVLRTQLRVRGLGQDEQGIKASVDPGESQV